MRYSLFTLALALTGASARRLAPRGQSCCFGLTASGTDFPGVPVEQLSDGQLRINQTGLSGPSSFCLNGNGGLYDSDKRGCVNSPPTTQIQCDATATSSPGWSVSSSGQLQANGSSTFYACPTGDNGGYNIYEMPIPNQTCEKVTLMTTGGNCVQSTTTTTMPPTTTSTCPASTETCTVTESNTVTETCTVTGAGSTVTVTGAGQTVTVTGAGKTVTETCTVTAPCTSSMAPPPTTSMAPPPTTAPPTTTSAPPPSSTTCTTTSAASTCPTTLSGNWQYPHLIVPINSSSPNTAYGTSYDGTVSSTISSIFDFDIPSSYAGDTCTIVFLWPEQSQLQTSSYTTSGSGGVNFYSLASPATGSTTYANCPAKGSELASVAAMPGNSYVVSSGPCAAGQRIGILAEAYGSFALTYFQDYNPSPIGLYLTSC